MHLPVSILGANFEVGAAMCDIGLREMLQVGFVYSLP